MAIHKMSNLTKIIGKMTLFLIVIGACLSCVSMLWIKMHWSDHSNVDELTGWLAVLVFVLAVFSIILFIFLRLFHKPESGK